MDYNHLLCKIDKSKLVLNGFTESDGVYERRIDLRDSLYVIISIARTIIVRVFDSNFNDEYLPFNNMSNNGEYVSSLRNEVDLIIKNIVNNTSVVNNNIDDLIDYVKKKYNAYVHNPFKDNSSLVLKNDKNKWFGLIMNISYKVLGVSSEDKVNVINIKLDPNKINELIDNEIFFRAYHMNKKYWITINLDSNINFSYLCSLVDMSYNLVK